MKKLAAVALIAVVAAGIATGCGSNQGTVGGATTGNTQQAVSGQTQQGTTGTSPYQGGNAYGLNPSLSMEEAKNIALSRVPGATDQNIRLKLDYDDGWLLYEGDIIYNRMEYEFEIDANSGTILKWEQELW